MKKKPKIKPKQKLVKAARKSSGRGSTARTAYPPAGPIDELIAEAGWQNEMLRRIQARTGHKFQDCQIRAYRRGMYPRRETLLDFEKYSPGFIAKFDVWHDKNFKAAR